jgi:hypothetical protein
VLGFTLDRGNAVGLFGAWGLAVAAGMFALSGYMTRPGDPGAPPGRWPAGTAMRLDGRRPRLLIFLHPRCPCSRASLSELGEILDRCGERVAASAVVFRPRGAREGWFPADLATALADRPGLGVYSDPGGDEARRFGVATSGHVLLYDERGDLIFSGGITPGRGGRGDNVGRAELLGQIMGRHGGDPPRPVFGCPLATPRPAPDSGRPR